MTDRSFTTPTNLISFDINGGTPFTSKPVVPAGALLALAGRTDDEAVIEMFRLVLDEDSWSRFEARMNLPYVAGAVGDDMTIDTVVLGEVTEWLQERLSTRPTELPSGSPGGQPTTGPTSTATAPNGG